jgi:hypothetical protein
MAIETKTFEEWKALDPALNEHEAAFRARHWTGADQLMDLATLNLRIKDSGVDYVATPAPPAGAATVPPSVLTVPAAEQQGAALLCTSGEWEGAPLTYAYQWLKDDVEVASAGPELDVTADDVGSTYTCNVTATNSLGSASSMSNAVIVDAGGGAARGSDERAPERGGRDHSRHGRR